MTNHDACVSESLNKTERGEAWCLDGGAVRWGRAGQEQSRQASPTSPLPACGRTALPPPGASEWATRGLCQGGGPLRGPGAPDSHSRHRLGFCHWAGRVEPGQRGLGGF